MGAKIDALLKISVAVSLVVASGSVAYYHLVYVPQKDARIELERKTENARAEYARQDERARQ